MKKKYHVTILPVMLDLYHRLAPQLQEKIETFMRDVQTQLPDETTEFHITPVCALVDEMRAVCRQAQSDQTDLLIVAHLSYSPSGQILPALMETKLPLLLWPIQPMAQIDAATYDHEMMLLNHGMHGTQDLANMLRRAGRAHGILHGYWQNDQTRDQLRNWVRAGRMVQAMRQSRPLVLGSRFEDMLDLQLDQEEFVRAMDLQGREIPAPDYLRRIQAVDKKAIQNKVQDYHKQFAVAQDCSEELLEQAAMHTLAMKQLMEDYQSKAIGINFLNLCNDPAVSDACHIAACELMAQGFGYGGEGDWTTAMMGYALMQAGCQTSFTEMFSVGYADNRIVLRHWGEGNHQLARGRVAIEASSCKDKQHAKFAVMSFEFQPGEVMLININTTPSSEGQIISIGGEISTEALPGCGGPRGIFMPDSADAAELLTGYAYSGGSHHLNMIYGDHSGLLNAFSALTGWNYFAE